MGVGLQKVFLRLGVAVVAILLCFHLYLREKSQVSLVTMEMVRWEEMKGGDPAISRVTMSDYGDVNLRRLTSLERKGQDYQHEVGVADKVGVVDEVGVAETIKPSYKDQTNDTKSEEIHQNLTDRFSLPLNLSLPTPQATLPLPLLLRCQWVGQLRTHLASLPPSPPFISLVSSDIKYLEVLLNWLISALVKGDSPLTNILVLSLDHSLCQLLDEREIPCLHVPSDCLLRSNLSLSHHVAFTQVHITRLLVMRLLNYWEYDVANYDSDAVILRNPEGRYGNLRERHFIGSVGHFPHELDRRWGRAVCIGVVLIRAAPQSELYWDAMSEVIPETPNDQARLNWALDAMAMTWDNPHSNVNEAVMTGAGREGFKAAVLPIRDVCRQSCSRRRLKEYLVWHKGGAQNRDGKKAYASKGGVWYLRDNWQQINKQTSSKGVKWLTEIAR